MTNSAASPSSASNTPMETDPKSKRKASTAGLPANSRPVKRRASKACCCCRARKVRCDVVENGSPCTNCRLDQVECIVTESKRRKFVHVESVSRLISTPQNHRLTSNAPCCHYTGNHVWKVTMAIHSCTHTPLPRAPRMLPTSSAD
ncbi:hypothetical protein BO86DRAFT_167638 [Aspergillus japonicus CBS 114.51]|uniref:Zn(2)-C6 fungal-type domain-containing protein n=1 Tax=Aspergillus japonicus CBS 114.51 TaxID=1448312 RepID=A0A8T8XEV4_ASPJA|nr:hypothetical protein BO86DRAFT_167638 [Aspergillus japonicus CBS 114.51]RAH85869.1 hypothetical protein BO86DRAFT_167638 [Aspergillus japonicus CBS 114.51]